MPRNRKVARAKASVAHHAAGGESALEGRYSPEAPGLPEAVRGVARRTPGSKRDLAENSHGAREKTPAREARRGMIRAEETTVLSLDPEESFVETPLVSNLTERALSYLNAG